MSTPSFDALNNLMVQAVNQFQQPIYNWVWITNPYISLFQRREFDPMDGLIPKVVTTSAALPTSYPDWPNLALSNGTGGGACDVSPTTINFGYTERNYQLQAAAWDTPVLCLTDLQFDWQAAQTISNLQDNLRQYMTTTWADWYRVQNVCQINNKITTAAAGAYSQDSNTDCDFSALTGAHPPTAALSWDHLNPLYDQMIAVGAEVNAVGYSEGQPLFTICCGPGIKRSLYQTDTKVRDTVNWGDAFQNFTARGINTSINGFIPNVDQYARRYDAAFALIYPFENVSATVGTKWAPNPNYRTVARGGTAVYEEVIIACRDIYEVRPRSIGPTQFGMASFDPVNYVGDIRWINNKDNDVNPLGTKGYYRCDVQVAARPVRPEVGFAILTLAVDA